MKRVFIVGAIGFGKMGDECLLLQIIHNTKHNHPGVHIGVLSHEPGKTAKLGVEAVPRGDVKAMWEAVEDSDTVVWLQSGHTTEWRSQSLETFLVRLAQWRKKRTHAYRILDDRQPSGWAKGTFDRCNEKIDITNDHTHPLQAVRRSQVDGLRHLQDEGIHLTGKPIALCVSKQIALAQTDQIAALADHLIDEGATLLFMPADHYPDMEAANHIVDKMDHSAAVMRKAYAAQEWIDILGAMRTVVTNYYIVQAVCDSLNVHCVGLDGGTIEDLKELILSAK